MKNLSCLGKFFVCTVGLFTHLFVFAQRVPAPEEVIGHKVGEDYKLAGWGQILSYYRRLDASSDRVRLRYLGKTTEGRDLIAVEISSPATIRRIEEQFAIQRRLHDPRLIADADEEARVLSQAKVVILISLSLHATEVAGAQMGMELAYELATRTDPLVQNILENCVVVLIACANPDGLDMVKEWYERTLNTPYEGASMPWLYHRYVGHDNNRDWWLISQKETINVTHYLYRVCFPTILYDVHQMGGNGPRMFVPPFHNPVNPNIDPWISQGIFLVGAHMAAALTSEGKKGVVWGAIYDNWWQGGMRTTPQRHNIVAVLTEAASARIASPVVIRREQLSGATRGLPSYDLYVNFPDPWLGGVWRLRDIVDYEKICCYALLDLGARYREMWVKNQLELSRRQIELGKKEPPFGWVVSSDQKDPGAIAELLRCLILGGIEVYRATRPFSVGAQTFPSGTYVLPAAQPYRLHLKDLMEPQVYPKRLEYPGGPAETPYDVAGWTAPLQMGVRIITLNEPFTFTGEKLTEPPRPARNAVPPSATYVSFNQRIEDVPAFLRLGAQGFQLAVVMEKGVFPLGALVVSETNGGTSLKEAVDAVHGESFAQFLPWNTALEVRVKKIRIPRVGLYQSWTANMDEGWTRWIFERYGIPYTTVRNADVRKGKLRERFDCLFFPQQSAAGIINGVRNTLPEYSGGIGEEGVQSLKEFLSAGGTLVLMDDACGLARSLGIPVRNALANLGRDRFYCPGSILRLNVNPEHPLGWGMEREAIAYFDRSWALEFDNSMVSNATVVATYGQGNPLLSGFLLGEEFVAGKPAIAEVPVGKGLLVLFGFRTQFRAQPYATFKLLFNAMVLSVLVEGND
ncbi:MAG: M14 family metallopeptidase [Candidatus Caldarchaeum sp.]